MERFARVVKATSRLPLHTYVKIRGEKDDRYRYSTLDNSVHGLAFKSAFRVFDVTAAEEQMRHKDHVDQVLGYRTRESLVACPAGSSNITWVPTSELLSVEPPPATPESLHEEASSKFPHFIREIIKAITGHGYVANEYDLGTGQFKKDVPVKIDDTTVRMTDPTKSRYEATDGLGYWKPIPEATFADLKNFWEQVNETNYSKAASIKNAKIVHEDGKWCVKSETNPEWRGGCYDTKEEAAERLKQVEMFKHMRSSSLDKRSQWMSAKELLLALYDEMVKEDPREFVRVMVGGMTGAQIEEMAKVAVREWNEGASWLNDKNKFDSLIKEYVGDKLNLTSLKREAQRDFFVSKRAFKPLAKSHKFAADVYTLTQHIQTLRERMEQVRDKMESRTKQASEVVVEMSKADFVKEHEKLVDVLEHPTKEKLEKEKEEQQKELKEVSASEHPLELPAVEQLFKDLRTGIDLVENIYNDKPDVIDRVEELENKLFEIEKMVGLDIPLLDHEKAEVVHKDAMRPMPTEQPGVDEEWVYDSLKDIWFKQRKPGR